MEPTVRSRGLGLRIREAREAKGWSLRNLAASSGLAHSFISNLESGRYRTASPDKLSALARALDIPADDLLVLSGYRVPETLPSFGPYLRSRYGEQLPESAISQLNDYFELLRDKYSDEPDADAGAAPSARSGGSR